MQKYVFIIKNKKPSVLTKDLYYRHIEHIKSNVLAGRLCLVGPLKGGEDQLLQVYQADSLAEARQYIQSDPYIKDGLYTTCEAYELLELKAENNWLMDTPRIQEMLRSLETDAQQA
jgi:uncharacterized protein